jgi:hypothetical protein
MTISDSHDFQDKKIEKMSIFVILQSYDTFVKKN